MPQIVIDIEGTDDSGRVDAQRLGQELGEIIKQLTGITARVNIREDSDPRPKPVNQYG